MIYFIDEDQEQISALVFALEYHGYEVTRVNNADDGLDAILAMGSEDRAIVDVMLGTKDISVSRFNRNETKDFLRTGVILVEKAIEVRGDFLKGKLLFFTNASQANDRLFRGSTVDFKRLGIEVLQKSAYSSPTSFVNKLRDSLLKKVDDCGPSR